ncbi:MAG TPA: tRNA (adenosine(37)-N6)-threonylcarbamoyltransferase complex dimerization subunit type 1 TsaB [Gemmatimonadaceae bacterium]|nr:tRNA (adenosine(37)-N6)-threonylcarbamoyltransferase complex dimerization subunit type 1 TsaB [Gemmatimonadaceae bacterium]
MSSRSLTLALDASTYRGTVAVLDGASVLAEETVAMRGAEVERLMPAVAAAIAAVGATPRDLARVVCGAGPGSFTSLRIAGSIAKGMAMASGAPLHAVSSLLLVVAGAELPLAAGRYLVLLDAMRDERFAATVIVGADGAVAPDGGAGLVSREAAASMAAEHGLTCVGPGEQVELWPQARGVARLAGLPHVVPVSLDAWEPDYGRLAEAQVKWEAAHGRPLPAG